MHVNIGMLGHVDSGKTSLCRKLSTYLSTAALDKHPQSLERGITLDLGFSAFVVPFENHPDFDSIRVTLVDCPGHASLIRTIIGGSSIIDMVVLVVDITKGIQAQTAECLILASITTDKLLIVLNKIDLIPVEQRESEIQRMKQLIALELQTTPFPDAEILPVSTVLAHDSGRLTNFTQHVRDIFLDKLPQRSNEGPLLIAVDHCFPIKGKGTVLTGTVLQGQVTVGDTVEFPALNLEKKVKSMQSFHEEVKSAAQGDRIGFCVAGLNADLIERGIAAKPKSLNMVSAAIAIVKKVRGFTLQCDSNSKCHVTIGHATTVATVHFFGVERMSELLAKSGPLRSYAFPSLEYDFEEEYQYQQAIHEDQYQWALLQFEHPVLCPPSSILIGSRLDVDVATASSRIAFCGKSVHRFTANTTGNHAPQMTRKERRVKDFENIKILKPKMRIGVVEKVMDDKNEAIVRGLFKKESDMSNFLKMQVRTRSEGGAIGHIESGFGKSGKVRVIFRGKKPIVGDEIVLQFSKAVFDRTKKLYQRNIELSLPPPAPTTAAAMTPSPKEETSKIRQGIVDRLKGDTTADNRNPIAIVVGMFSNNEEVDEFLNRKIKTEQGDLGIIEKAFGKMGKCRVLFPDGTLAKVGDTVVMQVD